MKPRLRPLFLEMSLSERFMLVSLLILVAGTLGIGWWVAGQIEAGVVYQSAATAALLVDSFIRPYVEELRETRDLSPTSRDALGRLLRDTPLGQQIVAFKVWDGNGRVLYSTDMAVIGQTFPMHEPLARALEGQIAAHISELDEAENAPQGRTYDRLIEIYRPIRLGSTDRFVAAAEFYQTVDNLEQELAASQRRSWLIVSAVMLGIYLLLAVFVRQSQQHHIGWHCVRCRFGDAQHRTSCGLFEQELHDPTALVRTDDGPGRSRKSGTCFLMSPKQARPKREFTNERVADRLADWWPRCRHRNLHQPRRGRSDLPYELQIEAVRLEEADADRWEPCVRSSNRRAHAVRAGSRRAAGIR